MDISQQILRQACGFFQIAHSTATLEIRQLRHFVSHHHRIQRTAEITEEVVHRQLQVAGQTRSAVKPGVSAAVINNISVT
ncbi:hypothetical protein A6R71_15190 [Xanthomonas translucens pv. arrhenatheri]|nr:hypothetical protein A6R71_15190 [Xanthomonas translucens pv. arrhenatheri]